MDPISLILLVGLALVFVYATRRSMRGGLPSAPPTQPAPPGLPEASRTNQPADTGATARHKPASGNQPAAKDRSRRRGPARPGDPGWQDPDPAGPVLSPGPAVPANLRQMPNQIPKQVPRPAPGRSTVSNPSYRNPHNLPRRKDALFGSRAELQHAVVGMTVLGPCRALAPYSEPAAATESPRSG
jgi:hypothetical protein